MHSQRQCYYSLFINGNLKNARNSAYYWTYVFWNLGKFHCTIVLKLHLSLFLNFFSLLDHTISDENQFATNGLYCFFYFAILLLCHDKSKMGRHAILLMEELYGVYTRVLDDLFHVLQVVN